MNQLQMPHDGEKEEFKAFLEELRREAGVRHEEHHERIRMGRKILRRQKYAIVLAIAACLFFSVFGYWVAQMPFWSHVT